MKKTILIVALVIFGISNASAQEYWHFGVKGGLNFSTVTGDGFDSPDMRTGFNVGLLAEIPVSGKFSVQPEVLYSAKGFDAARRDQNNFLDNDQNVVYQLDYIDVPVLANIYLTDGLSVQAGPSFNFKVNEQYDYQPYEDGGNINFDQAQDFELGGAAGLQYKFNNGLFLQGRYNYGFTDIYENSNTHNSVIQAGIGYLF